jgi:hypothetical protein
MNRTLLTALLLGALLAGGVQAQDQKPAAEAQSEAAKPAPGQEPDPKYIEGIIKCLAVGLTDDWQKTWIEVQQISRDSTLATRQFVAEFFLAKNVVDVRGERMRTCGDQSVLENIVALNAYLPESQRRWTSATFTFFRDGRYTVYYDYRPIKPAPAAKPAAKAPAKKKQEATK